MSGIADSPEMALISESVENANARIRFFRVAFGSASPDQSLGRSEVVSILKGAARGGRLSYCWEPEGDLPRQDIRIVFLVLLCLESAMPFGGDITVSARDGQWTVTATAGKFRVIADLWASLTTPRLRVDITAAQVQFALLPQVLADQQRALTTDIRETEIVVTL